MSQSGNDDAPTPPAEAGLESGWPSLSVSEYLNDPAARKLADFFQAKGLAAIKAEDRSEQWYADWLRYQAEHRLYANLLCPKEYSTVGGEFDLPRYVRFLELFAYHSAAHGYSLQVTFLGLFPILMGTNQALKHEAVAALEAGGVLALGVSEKEHGSDLLAGEFTVRQLSEDRFCANGSKCYIGNCNVATLVSVLARKEDARTSSHRRRAPFLLFALRPQQSNGFRNVRKIGTLGVRSAYVGEFEVKGHELPLTDVIAEGRDAWDAVLGTVTLGKFFLGFGAIGICERALEEARAHLTGRILYGKPAIEMPHIRSLMTQAYVRLAAMKLYAYRALDYVRSASEADRRYLLFCAVQKAKVSTEGVKVMSLLSECVGAKGFESDTYLEMALRDIQLFPGLEGSTHINLALTTQFLPQYFSREQHDLRSPDSSAPSENPYLMHARAGAINTIEFAPYLRSYQPLMSVPNVRCFARQVTRLALFFRGTRGCRLVSAGLDAVMNVGRCLATIAYAQLIAEGSASSAPPLTSIVFGVLVHDLTESVLALASREHLNSVDRMLLRRAIAVPRPTKKDFEIVSCRMAAH